MTNVQIGTVELPKKAPERPPNNRFSSIAELFAQFQAKLEGVSIVDPCGQRNSFFAENFPHLVKLEFYDRKQGKWVDAKASLAVEQLRIGTFDESRYRIGDLSRPRTLFWVPDIIANPDAIHDNIRDDGKTEVYSKRFSRKGSSATLKIVLVRRNGNARAVITSFWCTEKYHKKCIKLPVKHS